MTSTDVSEDTITWEQWYKLSQDLDEVARVTLQSPNWSSLAEDDDTPFSQPTVFDQERGLPDYVFIEFALQPGTSKVTDQYLASNPGEPFNMPSSLNRLLQRNLLMLVTKADICWCNSVFRLVNRPLGGCYVQSTDDQDSSGDKKRCCWSLHIPQIGDNLDEDQEVIPWQYVERWTGGEVPLQGQTAETVRLVRPACTTKDGDPMGEVWWTFKKVPNPEENERTRRYRLTHVARRLTANYISWPIKVEWMDKIVAKIDQLGQPGVTGGAVWNMLSPYRTKMQGSNIPLDNPNRVLSYEQCPGGNSAYTIPIANCGDDPPIVGYFAPLGNTSKDPGPQDEDHVIPPGCGFTYRELQMALNCRTVHIDAPNVQPQDEPLDMAGCLTRAGVDPWMEDACGAITCVQDLLKVYAHTYNQFRDILQLIPQVVLPYHPNRTTPLCCFDGLNGRLIAEQGPRTGTVTVRNTAESIWGGVANAPSRVIDGTACAPTTNGLRLVAEIVGACNSGVGLSAYVCSDDPEAESMDYSLQLRGTLTVNGSSKQTFWGGKTPEEWNDNTKRSAASIFASPGPGMSISMTCREAVNPKLCEVCDAESDDPDIQRAIDECPNFAASIMMSAVITMSVYLLPAGVSESQIRACRGTL